MDIRDGALDGIHAQGASVLEFDVSISNVGGDGVNAQNCRTIKRSLEIERERKGGFRIVGCGGGGVVATQCASVLLSEMVISACGGPGLEVTAASGEYLTIELEKARVTSCAGPGAVTLDASQSLGATLRVNGVTCADNVGHGFHVLGSNLQPSPGSNTAIVAHEMGHNFSMDNGGDGIRIELDGSTASRPRCAGTVATGCTASGPPA